MQILRSLQKLLRLNLICLVMIGLLGLFFLDHRLLDLAHAALGITERDYISERERKFEGVGATIGATYTLSFDDSYWPKQVTFDMGGVFALLVLIEHEETPSSVVVLASEPSSPRILKVVWAHDDLRTPVSFWTSDYWKPDESCDPSGCPKIRFQVIQGGAAVTILAKRKSY